MLTLALPGTSPVVPQSVETRPKAGAAQWLDTLPQTHPQRADQHRRMRLYTIKRQAIDNPDGLFLRSIAALEFGIFEDTP